MSYCTHTVTQGRAGESGSWCRACGVKVFAVDDRECKDCTHHVRLMSGSICRRHVMAVVPSMNVTYRIADGSCFELAGAQVSPPALNQEGEQPTNNKGESNG